ncbi:MAG: hypothetical protein CMJ58_08535 [Planctomycetaceae bacterium]|nr:hypothetical protein [Planctomycetaceae bacterium]
MAAPQRPDLSAKSPSPATGANPTWPILARLPAAGEAVASSPPPTFDPPPTEPLEAADEPPSPATQSPPAPPMFRVDPPAGTVTQATEQLAADCAVLEGFFTEQLAARGELPESDFLNQSAPVHRPHIAVQPPAGTAAERAFALYGALAPYASVIVTAALIASAGLLYWLMLGPQASGPAAPESPADWSQLDASASTEATPAWHIANESPAAEQVESALVASPAQRAGEAVGADAVAPTAARAAIAVEPTTPPAEAEPVLSLPPTDDLRFPSTGHSEFDFTQLRPGGDASTESRVARQPADSSAEPASVVR